MTAFRGDIEQIPPMMSAIKIDGQKLYELARRGEEIERPARSVHIHELELTGFEAGEFPVVDFRVVCSSGTYIRTLADDIGRALGGRAHLVGLRRTRIGSLQVGEAAAMDELIEDPDRFRRGCCPSRTDWPISPISRSTTTWRTGSLTVRCCPPRSSRCEEPTAVLDGDGRLLAIYARHGSRVKPEVVVA